MIKERKDKKGMRMVMMMTIMMKMMMMKKKKPTSSDTKQMIQARRNLWQPREVKTARERSQQYIQISPGNNRKQTASAKTEYEKHTHKKNTQYK